MKTRSGTGGSQKPWSPTCLLIHQVVCRRSIHILLSHREAQRGASARRFVLFSSPPLNLFTNDLVRGNTYQLPVSANEPNLFRLVCGVGRETAGSERRRTCLKDTSF